MDSNAFAYSWLKAITYNGHALLRHLSWKLTSLGGTKGRQIRVICLADTHSQRCDIPYGELLIHAGDLSLNGSATEIQETIDWLKSLPHKHKVVVAGNSDRFFDARSRLPEDMSTIGLSSGREESKNLRSQLEMPFDWGEIHYLQGTSVTLDCSRVSSTVPKYVNIYGAPFVPECGPDTENAFQYPVSHNPWAGKIPESTDILVTHTPPKFHRDWYCGSPEGCPWLLQELWKVRPLLHVFGHVHTSYGTERVVWNDAQSRWEEFCSGVQELLSQNEHPITLAGILRPKLWLDAAMVMLCGLQNLLTIVIAPRRPGWQSTLMVNAACMSDDGQLGKAPHTIIL
ncbi:hypothetical protein N7532_002005 [Penicillium argentinense]|uniref:Calcineurin-like phosphoesterase domain-containing protein n=1 Tax=Penicillium argentinense TaxID=1131581 RepID=A0A9W9G4H2_9EURO|nr:uncharacterized protein N7532_002005 [Penicillium argentinense]KAJ5111470.1 hypothetical protein N7532_002005 [Penicillium argentinense]